MSHYGGQTAVSGFTIIVFTITALISAGFLTYFALKAEFTKLFRSFLTLQFLQMLWLIAKILRMLAPTVAISWYPALIQYISVCFVGAAYFHFAYHYCTGRRLPTAIRYIIFAVSFVNYLFFATNPLHHQFFTVYDPNHSARGPLFWVHTISAYTMLILGYVYLFKGFYQKVLVKFGVLKYLVYVSLAIPFGINVMMQIGYIHFPIDLTPLMFNVTYLTFGFMIYRYQFLNISVIAKEDIYAHMQEGIMVFDHNYHLESANNIIKSIVPKGVQLVEGVSLDELEQDFSTYIMDYHRFRDQLHQFLDSDEAQTAIDVALMVESDIRYYQVDFDKTDKDNKGLLVRAFSINRYVQAILKLEEQTSDLEEINHNLSQELAVKKRLALAKERNRISGEVHDILGHSLTVVISLLEATKTCMPNQEEQAKEKLQIAIETTRYNLNNLKQSLSNPTDGGMTSDELFYDLDKIIKPIEEAGTHVEVIKRGHDLILPSHYYDLIYHICQEALTNAMRHGKAKEITLALRVDSQTVDLMIVDNGMGSTGFEKGNGLTNIQEKVQALKGYFSCGSPDGEGFTLHAKMPMS